MLISLVSCQEQEEVPYKFFVAGHAYGAPGVDNKGFHPPFQEFMNKHCNEFELGFFTGDFILKATENNWDELDSATQKWNLPLHFVAGNHDVGDRSLFTHRHNETNRSFVRGNNLFVIWDVNSTGWMITEDQWAMITASLERNKKPFDNILLFTHQLIYLTPDSIFRNLIPNSRDGKAPKLNFFKNYYSRIKALQCPVYLFCGDVGAHPNGSEIMYHKFENLHAISSGMGGGNRDNFLEVSINGSEVKVDVRFLKDEKLHSINGFLYPSK